MSLDRKLVMSESALDAIGEEGGNPCYCWEFHRVIRSVCSKRSRRDKNVKFTAVGLKNV
jgi:hypothetical protein